MDWVNVGPRCSGTATGLKSVSIPQLSPGAQLRKDGDGQGLMSVCWLSDTADMGPTPAGQASAHGAPMRDIKVPLSGTGTCACKSSLGLRKESCRKM